MTTRYKNVQIYVDPKDHKELKKKVLKQTGYASLSELHRDVERQIVELYKQGVFTTSRGKKKVKLLTIQ